MEELDAGRPLLAQDLGLGLPPVGDGLGQAELLDARGLLPAIGGSFAGAAEVVPDRPLGNAQDSRRLALRLASLLQDLDRHDLLPCELCQGGASERALDVQDQLESPWLACRWMFSTTVVLNACQARNDSGSLTPSFTGLVTRTSARLGMQRGLNAIRQRDDRATSDRGRGSNVERLERVRF